MSHALSSRLVALLVAIALQGCSIFMRRVPDDHATRMHFECTDSTSLPVVDLGASTWWLGSGVWGFADGEPIVGGVSLGLAAVVAIAGITGMHAADRCMDAKNDLIYRQQLQMQRELEDTRLRR